MSRHPNTISNGVFSGYKVTGTVRYFGGPNDTESTGGRTIIGTSSAAIGKVENGIVYSLKTVTYSDGTSEKIYTPNTTGTYRQMTEEEIAEAKRTRKEKERKEKERKEEESQEGESQEGESQEEESQEEESRENERQEKNNEMDDTKPHVNGPNRYELVRKFGDFHINSSCTVDPWLHNKLPQSNSCAAYSMNMKPEVKFIFTNPEYPTVRASVYRSCDGVVKFVDCMEMNFEYKPVDHKTFHAKLVRELNRLWNKVGRVMPENDLVIEELCSDLKWVY